MTILTLITESVFEGELASVAQGLGAVAIRDLKTVCVRLSKYKKVGMLPHVSC